MFDIIDIQDDFIVINKHANISVHKDQQEEAFVATIENFLDEKKLYLVHRLDKMTSGLLILAKTSQAAARLSNLFATRQVEKFYLAIGSKKPKKKQGLIYGDMVRSRRRSWKLTSKLDNPAVTQFFSVATPQGRRLFLCKPYTGKTHQIRVALNAVGAPILGDPIYAPRTQADRGYLHAYAIRFIDRGVEYTWHCSPLDPLQGEMWQAFADHLQAWQAPWLLDWPEIPNKIKY